MKERAYTVLEIMQMRESIERILSEEIGVFRPEQVEAQLQTYMVAGVEPAELKAEADKWD